MSNLALGVDVGGSHVCSAVIDIDNGTIVGAPVTTDVAHTEAADVLFAAWAKNLEQCLAAAPEPVTRIGMDFPGPFDYKNGISQMEHKMPHIKGLSVADELRKRMANSEGLEFRFVNDANAFALGEAHFGGAKDADRVIVLAIGTGLGSGFIADHQIVEEGDTVPPDGEVWNLPYGDDIADAQFSTRGIVGRYEKLTGITLPGAKEVAERFDTDPAARQTLESFGWELADFTAPLIKQFQCKDILIGGNIARCLNLFGLKLNERYAELGLEVNVRACKLLSDAAMMGAAALYK